MGLGDYKKWKRKNEVLEFLAEYGITEADLKYLPTAIRLIKNQPVEATKPTNETPSKEDLEKKLRTLTPEQLVEAFSGGMQEFYPDGKPTRN